MARMDNMVTISLEEYKELLLRDKPESNDKTIIFEKIMNIIENNLKYTDRDGNYYSEVVMKNTKILDPDKVIREIMTMIKYLDFDRYITIWNKIMNTHRKEEEEKMKAEQMRNAKEIRNEVNNEQV